MNPDAVRKGLLNIRQQLARLVKKGRPARDCECESIVRAALINSCSIRTTRSFRFLVSAEHCEIKAGSWFLSTFGERSKNPSQRCLSPVKKGQGRSMESKLEKLEQDMPETKVPQLVFPAGVTEDQISTSEETSSANVEFKQENDTNDTPPVSGKIKDDSVPPSQEESVTSSVAGKTEDASMPSSKEERVTQQITSKIKEDSIPSSRAENVAPSVAGKIEVPPLESVGKSEIKTKEVCHDTDEVKSSESVGKDEALPVVKDIPVIAKKGGQEKEIKCEPDDLVSSLLGSGEKHNSNSNNDKKESSSERKMPGKQKGINSSDKNLFSASSEERTEVKQKGFTYEARRMYGTRQGIVEQEREKYLAMKPQEKRKLYTKKNYVTLEEIDTWAEFYKKNSRSLRKLYPSAKEIKEALKSYLKIEADEELNAKVSLFEGDITTLEIDGIVNAANSSLLGGGGIDGAIHRAAGSQLLEECRFLNGCRTGDAKTTCGYKLPAKYVIHTVGPQTTSPSDLQSCYVRCLEEMNNHKMRSIAFCCISTGIYGYPNDMAVHEALGVARKRLMELKKNRQLDSVDRIIFCLFLEVDIELYRSWMQVYFPTKTERTGDVSPKKTVVKTSDDQDSPGKEVKDRKNQKGKNQSLKSSSSGIHESSLMEYEDVVDSEEDMEADDSSSSAESDEVPSRTDEHKDVNDASDDLPDKKSKLDPRLKHSIKMDMC